MNRAVLRYPFVLHACGLLLMAIAGSAWAHHPMGGAIPATAWHGFLSGIGHPLIGIDHLAFIVAIGLICAFAGLRSPVFPLTLVAATVAGAALSWAGLAVPAIELVVAVSLLGAAIVLFRMPSPRILLSALAMFGAVFHGLAYGEAILGAEPAPLVSYLIGFSLIQMMIASAAFIAGAAACRSSVDSLRVVRSLAAACVGTTGVLALILAAAA
ncbi:Amidase [Stutzerimonas xanthomarina]|nr:Amidase [Stutzerimonas xanthomarina]